MLANTADVLVRAERVAILPMSSGLRPLLPENRTQNAFSSVAPDASLSAHIVVLNLWLRLASTTNVSTGAFLSVTLSSGLCFSLDWKNV